MSRPDIILLLFPSTGPDVLEPPFSFVFLGTTLKAASVPPADGFRSA